MHTHVPTRPTPTAPPAPRPQGWWGRWSLLLALLWSAGTAVLALGWSLGVLAHPFADEGAVLMGAILNAFAPGVGIAVTAAVGVVGAAVAARALRRRQAGDPPSRSGVALAWALTAVVLVTMVHGQLLAMLGYLPVVLTLGWFTPGMQAAYLRALLSPETVFLVSGVLGTLAWGAAALVLMRARRAACQVCGRRHDWTPAAEGALRRRALRVGRVAVAVAVVSALVYPAARIPWLFGIPVGMDEASWALLEAEGARATGVALGTAAVVGAVLMLGLVMAWGERVPRWLPWLGGRRVPVAAAVAPATVVSIALLSVGRGAIPTALSGTFPVGGDQAWVHIAALLAMLPWGLALAVATGAYALRRRAECAACGRGLPEPARR